MLLELLAIARNILRSLARSSPLGPDAFVGPEGLFWTFPPRFVLEQRATSSLRPGRGESARSAPVRDMTSQ